MEGVAVYTAQLAPHEQISLACYEQVIERGLQSFYEVGNALALIRDGRLYRATHATFEDYVRERWSIERRQAYRLIAAADVTQNVSNWTHVLPANEAQARPLTQLAPEQQSQAWQRIVETAPEGRVTAAHVEQVVQSIVLPAEAVPELTRPSVHFSSESDEWYTPPHIIERVVEFFGEIDLDPCSNSKAAPSVPAAAVWTKDDDGLTQPWWGRVYMNPPYGEKIGPWVQKLIELYAAGTIEAGIALLPARTDTQWFHMLWGFPLCFVRGRLRFSSAATGAPFPSVIALIGSDREEFARWFGDLGHIVNEHRGEA